MLTWTRTTPFRGLGVPGAAAFASLTAKTPEEVAADSFQQAYTSVKDLYDTLSNTYSTLWSYQIVMQNANPNSSGIDTANQTITYPGKMETWQAAVRYLAANGGIPAGEQTVFPFSGASVATARAWAGRVYNAATPVLQRLRNAGDTAAQARATQIAAQQAAAQAVAQQAAAAQAAAQAQADAAAQAQAAEAARQAAAAAAAVQAHAKSRRNIILASAAGGVVVIGSLIALVRARRKA